MITEITDHGIDLTGSEDQSVLVNYTLPSGDWTISIEVNGPITASEWGNLFQTAGSNPLYILDSQKSGSNPREYGTSSVSNAFFQIPVLDALGQDDWATITITKSGDLLTYYVNEISYGTVTYSSIPDPYTIGSINGTNLNGSTYDHLFADVANFRVFEGAATEEEIIQLLDTSSEDDSDSNNGGNLTQPMEEIIMSKFTFEGDFKGTKTHEMEESLPAILAAQKDKLEGSSALTGEDLEEEVAKYVAAGLHTPASGETASASAAAIALLIQQEIDALAANPAPAHQIGDDSMSLDSTGRGSLSFANCKMKKFLHAIQAKGMKICGDLQMVEGEIYLQDGTAASSLIKEVELVHGTLANDGTFTPTAPGDRGITDTFNTPDADIIEPIGEGDAPVADPDGDLDGDSTYGAQNLEAPDSPAVSGAGKWYLRILRPGNTVEYKAFDGLNNLLDGVGATGEVLSILDAMKSIESLQDAIREVVALQKIASIADVDALETKMDDDIASLVRWVSYMEDELKKHINAGDEDVVEFVKARLDEVEASFNAIHDDARLHGEASGLSLGECSHSVEFTSGDFSSHGDISKWLISVGIEETQDGVEVRRNDLESAWTAEMVDVAQAEFTLPEGHDLVEASELQMLAGSATKAVEAFEITLGEDGAPDKVKVFFDALLVQGESLTLQVKAGESFVNVDGAALVADSDEQAGKRLKVNASLEQCPEDESGTFTMVVNAVYCGEQDDVAYDTTAEFASPDYTLNGLNLHTGDDADSDTPGTKVVAGQYV